MITPIFRASQDHDHVIIRVKAPMARLADTEVEVDEHQVKLFAPPYFLRLSFEQSLATDGKEMVSYDADTTSIVIKMTKLKQGQIFNDLDLMTKLLAKPNNRNQTRAERPQIEIVSSSTHDDDESDEDEDVDEHIYDWEQTLWTDELERRLQLDSEPYGFCRLSRGVFKRLQEDIHAVVDIKDPDTKGLTKRKSERLAKEMIDFSGEHYLFDAYENSEQIELLLQYRTVYNNIYEHYIRRRASNGSKSSSAPPSSLASLPTSAATATPTTNLEESISVMSISASPIESTKYAAGAATGEETRTGENRRKLMLHTAPDGTGLVCDAYYDNVAHLDLQTNDKAHQYFSPELSNRENVSDNSRASVTFSDEELFKLKNLPARQYRLVNRSCKQRALLSLIDILYAYCYDLRTTEGQHTVESGWTLVKLSSTMCWFDDSSNSIVEVFTACIRRALIYPLYRHWDLATLIMSDVHEIFRIGRSAILKCLLDIHHILAKSSGEFRYILNDLYITDYCIWIQQVKPETIESIADAISKVISSSVVDKSSIGLELCELEEAAEIVLREQSQNAETNQ